MTSQLTARGYKFKTIINRASHALDEFSRNGLSYEVSRVGSGLGALQIPALWHAVRSFKTEITQCTSPTLSKWCGWIERLGGPPSIGYVHGFTAADTYRQQAHLLSVSSAVKQHLVSRGIPSDRVTVLHSALSPDDFYASRDPLLVRAEQGAEASTPVVGTFAELSQNKGQLDLLNTVPAIVRELPKTQFWFAGEGELWNKLRQIAERTGVLSNVRFLGHRHDVADLMNAVDVIALPACCEDCALVYIEAAILRKPCIGCRIGGTPEFIDDAQTGLLVPEHDVHALAESVLTLLTNRDRAARLGQNAFDRAISLFGWNRLVNTLEQVYEQVLDERGSHRQLTQRAAA